MRAYLIGLTIMAVLVGTLFRAAEQTGIPLMRMFGTFGIFLFGVVGTMALGRLQSRSGLREIEAALKSLEPEWVVTDWAYQGKGRPDYLVIGPGGAVAICLDETPQSAWARRAEASIARGRAKAEVAAGWVQQQLSAAANGIQGPLAGQVTGLPVSPVLLLNRRRAVPGYSAEGVPVLNAEELAAHIQSLAQGERLDQQGRIKLTRVLRGA